MIYQKMLCVAPTERKEKWEHFYLRLSITVREWDTVFFYRGMLLIFEAILRQLEEIQQERTSFSNVPLQ